MCSLIVFTFLKLCKYGRHKNKSLPLQSSLAMCYKKSVSMKNERVTLVLTTIVNVFLLIIIILILSTAKTQFEKLALSLLIFIAVNINILSAVVVKTIETKHTNDDKNYVRSLMANLEQSNLRFKINTAFNTCYLLITAFTILTNL